MPPFPSRYMLRTIDRETGEAVEVWLDEASFVAADGQRAIVLQVVESRTVEPRKDRSG